MKHKYLLALTPLVLLLELLGFNSVATLLREPSDMAVIAGVVLLSLLAFGNYFLIKLIIKLTK